MTDYVKKLLRDAKFAGLAFIVHGEDEDPDYAGDDPKAAEEAINAVDEVTISLHKGRTSVAWALIINELAPDERIADCGCGDWIDDWMKENIA